jgi:NADH dehydrogenase
MRRIVILGCGFGGFRAARELERNLAGRRRVQVSVVSDRADFLYTPLLPSVATGDLDPSHITFPIREAFELSTEVLVRPIDAIDLGARCLRSRRGDIGFDYLLIACGSQVDWGGHPEWAANALSFKTADDALKLREAVATALKDAAGMSSPERRRRRLTFVVGGGGPTGVELAGALLAALKNDVAPNAAPALVDALRVVLVEKGARILPEMPAELSRLTRTHLRELGMELRLGTSVVSRTENEVGLSTGEVVAADNLIWCGGVRAHEMVAEAGFDVDDSGRILVNATLKARAQSRAMPGIFALGDVACVGDASPRNAQVASQQAMDAAYNVIADLSGRGYRSWQYRPSGDLISLGRERAVAHVAGSAIDGRAARALYRLVHTALMPGGHKKASLLKDWLLANHRIGAHARPLLGADLGADLGAGIEGEFSPEKSAEEPE